MIIESTKDPLLISHFLAIAGSSLSKFRYFESRPITVISRHLVTLVGIENGIPISYGHLDPDQDKVWLGICVAEGWTGKGIGKKIMRILVDVSDNNSVTLSLSVDKDNTIAQELYDEFDFMIEKKTDRTWYYERTPHG